MDHNLTLLHLSSESLHGVLGAGVIACDLRQQLLKLYKAQLGYWTKLPHLLEETMPEYGSLIEREYEHTDTPQKERPRLGLTRYETRLEWRFTMLCALCALSIAAG